MYGNLIITYPRPYSIYLRGISSLRSRKKVSIFFSIIRKYNPIVYLLQGDYCLAACLSFSRLPNKVSRLGPSGIAKLLCARIPFTYPALDPKGLNPINPANPINPRKPTSLINPKPAALIFVFQGEATHPEAFIGIYFRLSIPKASANSRKTLPSLRK